MRKIPEEYPTFLIKASWRSTAVKFRVRAKDDLHAWDIASKQVKKMFGGMSCTAIEVLGTVNE